jgi:hypothetical protein
MLKPRFVVFASGHARERSLRDNHKYRGLYNVGFAQGPQKLNNGSGITIHQGKMDRDLAVYLSEYDFS